MNSSSVPANGCQPRSARRSIWRRRICRGEAATGAAVVPEDVGHHHRRPLLPGHRPQRVEVGLHREVAVAASTTRPSRSPRRCSCRRRRRAGSCSPRRRSRAPRRGSGGRSAACPGAGPPCRRSRAATVSTVPSATACLSSSTVTRSAYAGDPVRVRRSRDCRIGRLVAGLVLDHAARVVDLDLPDRPREVVPGARASTRRRPRAITTRDRERRVVERTSTRSCRCQRHALPGRTGG